MLNIAILTCRDDESKGGHRIDNHSSYLDDRDLDYEKRFQQAETNAPWHILVQLCNQAGQHASEQELQAENQGNKPLAASWSCRRALWDDRSQDAARPAFIRGKPFSSALLNKPRSNT